MRVLVAMPHFFGEAAGDKTNQSRQPAKRAERIRALINSIAGFHQIFGDQVYGLDHGKREVQQSAAIASLDLVVCTAGASHLLDELKPISSLYRNHVASVDPIMLGFECHRLMRQAQGQYDYYCYVEDDIIIKDPLFFRKLELFDSEFGHDALLQPNRYEIRLSGPIHKLYVDYGLRPAVTALYQSVSGAALELAFAGHTVRFERTTYPSAGSFFLNAAQLAHWVASPYFLDGDISYMSSLDSAATLSIMKTFQVYKPVIDQAWFLEVEHASPRWIGGIENQVRFVRHKDNA